MTNTPQRRIRRPRNPDRIRDGLDAIGVELDARLPPPAPPSIEEGLLERSRRSSPVMSDTPDRDVMPAEGPTGVRILIALATIQERQAAMIESNKASQQAAEARHASLMAQIATFVPRSEIEKDNKSMRERIDQVEGRLALVEKRIWGAVAGVAITALGAAASIFGVHLKPP